MTYTTTPRGSITRYARCMKCPGICDFAYRLVFVEIPNSRDYAYFYAQLPPSPPFHFTTPHAFLAGLPSPVTDIEDAFHV